MKSETDTEVLVHFIEEIQKREKLPIEEAVRIALSKVVGAYAIAVLDKEDPDKIIAARKASPLVIGIGDDEYFLASDPNPLAGHTSQFVFLNDHEVAVIHRKNGLSIKTINNKIQTPSVEEINLHLELMDKGDYPHYMLKEIYEQPKSVGNCMRGRINAQEGWIRVGGVEEVWDKIWQAKRFVIASCGTSWHAGLIGEYLFEDLARIPVEVEYASEMRYRNPIIEEGDVVLAISQSGETADTLAALETAKKKGALIYGIVNSVGSSIARMTDSGSYIHAGPEIGVASTKAFTGQVTLLSLMAIYLGYRRGRIPMPYYRQLLHELERIPEKIERVLQNDSKIAYIAGEIKDATNALYLGRGYNFPIALEGALKT